MSQNQSDKSENQKYQTSGFPRISDVLKHWHTEYSESSELFRISIFEFRIFLIMDKEIKEAIRVLKDGGIVIFPTDTAFGIGCRIDDEKAIKRLFKIRKRPPSQATPVLVESLDMAQAYLENIPQEVIDRLIEPYWPGAITLILQSRIDKVPKLVRGGGQKLGVRMPNHQTALALIRGVGVPVLGPSANFHGEKTPYRFEDLDKKLVKLVDYVVVGACALKQQSTVIDCSEKPWRIIRQGAIDIKL